MPASSTYRQWLARALAHALLADALLPGGCLRDALLARAASTLGKRPAWLAGLVDALLPFDPLREDVQALGRRIAVLPAFDPAFDAEHPPRIRHLILRPATMLRRPLGLHELELPALATHADLASWLGLDSEQLAWLAAPARAWRPPGAGGRAAATHYRCLLMPKRSGGLRLIEAPMATLKAVQRHLLDGLLDHVPAHEAAMGYVSGRSVIDHAAAHAGRAVVLRFDLRDFFNSIPASRVHALWHTLGYPDGAARTLTALTTARTPVALRERLQDDGGLDVLGAKRLASAHLPQGAPTSPALANLCCFRLDLRLNGLAKRFDASYTRYADDLVISGPAACAKRRRELQAWVEAIVRDEGFALQPRKTLTMPAHQRQQVAGIVVNAHPNLDRASFDRLKARLHRCTRDGPSPADDPQQLRGQLAWVTQLNPARGAKLQKLFEGIRWLNVAPSSTPVR
ncbi:RNA-directed DNA polymerase [Aquincola sp. S2]|uniref:RNA-directed DNA polymerase n=1 Tax=Pseudaquabacterium terrae TaxID=2732868 RepID=A0ABX2ECU8_9BURK|nr:reverse transcriptase family protein [Aquabacterium terrae]NRF66282.1 RNA-directed DNA polymerase [Aquabacterium terrae]